MSRRSLIVAAGFVTVSSISPPRVPAQEGRAPEHQSAIFYASGGIDGNEENPLRNDGRFNLKVSMARPDGTPTDGGSIRIEDQQGQTLVNTDTGPMFVAQLPAGNYQVHVDAEGKTLTRSVTVPAQGHVQVALTFPGSLGEEPVSNNRPGTLP